MDRPWSRLRPASPPDSVEIALAEIDVAIALVRRGHARRVVLAGLEAAEHAAAIGLARAQAAGMGFALERPDLSGHPFSLVVGPKVDG
jgi:hypothetical protein